MQNKRMKRVLSNGFYLNVKFDQNSASDHKRGENLKQKYSKVQDWELFDIKEGENLYKRQNKKNKRSNHSHVLSSLNGALAEDVDEKNIYDSHLFEGVAQTEHNADQYLPTDQGLVSCVHSVITVMNDYNGTISPGQILYLTVPNNKKPHRGIHKDKLRFCLAPVSSKEFAKEYIDKLIEFNSGTMTTRDIEKILTYDHIDKRRVAKALSQAAHGEKLDILLYPRACSGTLDVKFERMERREEEEDDGEDDYGEEY
jgi:hypothetical protein